MANPPGGLVGNDGRPLDGGKAQRAAAAAEFLRRYLVLQGLDGARFGGGVLLALVDGRLEIRPINSAGGVQRAPVHRLAGSLWAALRQLVEDELDHRDQFVGRCVGTDGRPVGIVAADAAELDALLAANAGVEQVGAFLARAGVQAAVVPKLGELAAFLAAACETLKAAGVALPPGVADLAGSLVRLTTPAPTEPKP